MCDSEFVRRKSTVWADDNGLGDDGRPQRDDSPANNAGLRTPHLPPLAGIERDRLLRFKGRILPEGRDLPGISPQRALRIPRGLGEEDHLDAFLGEQPLPSGHELGEVEDGLIGDAGDLRHT